MSVHKIAYADARKSGLRLYLDRPKKSLDDHNCIMVPWEWSERLANASEDARADFTIEQASRVRWAALGEVLHIDSLVAEALAPYVASMHQPYFDSQEDVWT